MGSKKFECSARASQRKQRLAAARNCVHDIFVDQTLRHAEPLGDFFVRQAIDLREDKHLACQSRKARKLQFGEAYLVSGYCIGFGRVSVPIVRIEDGYQVFFYGVPASFDPLMVDRKIGGHPQQVGSRIVVVGEVDLKQATFHVNVLDKVVGQIWGVHTAAHYAKQGRYVVEKDPL